MEKIIHFTVPDPDHLTSVQADVIDRALKLHPGWEVRIWGDPTPQQAPDFLLEQYWSKANSGAQLADLWRLDLLYKFGGVYVDSDLKLFKPLDDLVDRFDLFMASENGDHLTNALIGARKEHPALRQLIDQLRNAEPDWTLPANLTTGPHFFSTQLKWCKEITVLPRESFYTYGAFFKGEKKVHRHSHGEHLWEYSWKKTGVGPSPPALNEKTPAERGWHFLVELIKKPIKHCLIFGFKTWHRLRSLDPKRSQANSTARSYQCADELVVQTIHGYKIVADGHDIGLTPELIFNGFYELPEQCFLKNTVTGGDWVIDVGANIGTFSLLAAQLVGPFGRVFAFEPNPRPSRLMAKSLVMNWMHERVIQYPAAVGEDQGTVKFTFLPDRPTDGQVGQLEGTGPAFAQSLASLGQDRAVVLEVPSTRLDDEFPVDLPIKLLKIDAEGFEGCVLAGADRLLRRQCIDFIVMELLQEVAGSRWLKMVEQVNHVISYGYKICSLTEDGKVEEQKDLATALKAGSRNIVLMAKEQYRVV